MRSFLPNFPECLVVFVVVMLHVGIHVASEHWQPQDQHCPEMLRQVKRSQGY